MFRVGEIRAGAIRNILKDLVLEEWAGGGCVQVWRMFGACSHNGLNGVQCQA